MYLFVSILFQSKWQSSKWNLSSWRVDKKELTFLFSKTNKQWLAKNKNITHVNQFLLYASWTWVLDYRIWTDIATSPQLYIGVFLQLDICLFHYIFPIKKWKLSKWKLSGWGWRSTPSLDDISPNGGSPIRSIHVRVVQIGAV